MLGQHSPGATWPTGEFTNASVGEAHACAVLTTGTIHCSVENFSGQTDAPAGTFTALSAGGSHSCGLRSDGSVTCWGGNWHRQTDSPAGTFTTVSAGNPAIVWIAHRPHHPMLGTLRQCPTGEFIAVSAGIIPGTLSVVGDSHSCGLRTDGTIQCWSVTSGEELPKPAGEFTAVTAGDE